MAVTSLHLQQLRLTNPYVSQTLRQVGIQHPYDLATAIKQSHLDRPSRAARKINRKLTIRTGTNRVVPAQLRDTHRLATCERNAISMRFDSRIQSPRKPQLSSLFIDLDDRSHLARALGEDSHQLSGAIAKFNLLSPGA